jgi:tRNA(adenine34) deaminase
LEKIVNEDSYWLAKALLLAKQAAHQQEVPVGCVIVLDNKIIGEGFNNPVSSHDPSGHAEIIALRAASKKIENYRLIKSTLYVTLEPCLMCIGAMIHARIERLVFGAYDLKAGAVGGQINILEFPWLNHTIKYTGGILSEECGEILKQFFQERRK